MHFTFQPLQFTFWTHPVVDNMWQSCKNTWQDYWQHCLSKRHWCLILGYVAKLLIGNVRPQVIIQHKKNKALLITGSIWIFRRQCIVLVRRIAISAISALCKSTSRWKKWQNKVQVKCSASKLLPPPLTVPLSTACFTAIPLATAFRDLDLPISARFLNKLLGFQFPEFPLL